MKKSLLVVLAFFLATNINAQVEVSQTGHVYLGDRSSSQSNVEVTPNGQLILNFLVGSKDINTSPLFRFVDDGSRNVLGGINLLNATPHLNSNTPKGLSALNYTFLKNRVQTNMVSLLSFFEKDESTMENNASFLMNTMKGTQFATRFSVLPKTRFPLSGSPISASISNQNDVAIQMHVGYTGINSLEQRGILFDNTGNGQPTIRPFNGSHGYLGTKSYFWNKLYVREIFTNAAPIILSDISTQRNVETIDENIAAKLFQLRGVSYNSDGAIGPIRNEGVEPESEDGYHAADDQAVQALIEVDNAAESARSRYGFVAQEVEQLFPNAVYYDESTNQYGIRYEEIIPVLVEAVKTLQVSIREQRNLMANLLANNSNHQMDATNTSHQINIEPIPGIHSNRPNPFTETTQIAYLLPSDCKRAEVVLFDISGQIVQRVALPVQDSQGEVILYRKGLSAGVYECVLYCDGARVDFSRLMIQ